MGSDRLAGSCDVAIAGGGMVGGLLAVALADAGLRVVVLDAAAEPRMPVDEPGLRVSALTEASHWMLRHAGAWSHLPAQRLSPYRFMEVWDADGTGRVHFSAAEAGARQLGWIVENDAIAAALRARGEQAELDWRCGARIDSLRRENAGWTIGLGDGTGLRADLLVGADGARSMVRTAAGIPVTGRDSGQVALVGVVRTELVHQACARQRFMDGGPVALLPLFGDGHLSSLVWSMPPEMADEFLRLGDEHFDTALGEATEHVLGACRMQGPRGCFPIHPQHAASYVAHRLALVGDAAHVVHPLAGQGVNLGFLDAGVLAEEIRRAVGAGLPAHHDSVLRRYQRRRRGHNALMLNAFNGISTLFGQRDPLVRLVRNLGLRGVDGFAPARRFFIHEALGRGGDLPATARPDAGPVREG